MTDFADYDLDIEMVEATRADGKPRLRVYPCEETVVVLGRGSDAEKEVHLDVVRAQGIPVLRRPGGGCSVVLDPGVIIVAVALPSSGLGRNSEWFNNITKWLIEGLERLGIDGVYSDGVSDLVIENRKVGGSCIRRWRDCLYYSAALLITPDTDQVERFLKHPPREPEYRAGRDHSDFMGSLEGFSTTADIRTFVKGLKEVLRVDDIQLP